MADLADTRVSLVGQGTLIGLAQSASADGACLALVSGLSVVVRVVAGLTVALNDGLLIVRRGSAYYAIAVLPGGPISVPTPPEVIDTNPPPATGDKPPATKPTTTTGTLTCVPTATACFRDGSWRSDIGPVNSADLFQGRFGGSSFGRNTGVAFYGTKPHSLAGATVTRATIKVRRLQAGDFAARTPTLRLVSQSSRPSGAPTLNETTNGPSLAVNGTNNGFVIPNSWAQDIVDGSRGGIGITVAADSPYIQLAGRGSWSAAFTLSISWRRN